MDVGAGSGILSLFAAQVGLGVWGQWNVKGWPGGCRASGASGCKGWGWGVWGQLSAKGGAGVWGPGPVACRRGCLHQGQDVRGSCVSKRTKHWIWGSSEHARMKWPAGAGY